MIAQAKKMKLSSIAFTEHVNSYTDWFYDFQQNIDKLRSKEEMNILIGIEAKAIDFNGTIDAPQDIINKAEIIVGSVHRYPDGKSKLIAIDEIINLGEMKATEIEFRLAIGLLQNNQIDVLGHPFGVYSKFFSIFPYDYMEQLLVESLKRGIAIEINTKYNTKRDKLFKLLKDVDPYISIGSDAHNISEIAKSFNMIKKEITKRN